MVSNINRRKFIKKGTKTGMACCALIMSSKFVTARGLLKLFDDEKIDPKKLNFCGYTCPKDCKFHTATLENDLEKKKEAFEVWHIKERYGLDFDENIAFCWKCKNLEKPEGAVVHNCTVRACAMEKGHEACIQCDVLTTCKKDLWIRFPEFYKAVKEMQIKYKEQVV